MMTRSSNDRGEKMVLEALDRIREAEDKVEKMRQVAKEELGKYEKKSQKNFREDRKKVKQK